MSYMFNRATNFNQNISMWNVNNVSSNGYFKYISALTTANSPRNRYIF